MTRDKFKLNIFRKRQEEDRESELETLADSKPNSETRTRTYLVEVAEELTREDEPVREDVQTAQSSEKSLVAKPAELKTELKTAPKLEPSAEEIELLSPQGQTSTSSDVGGRGGMLDSLLQMFKDEFMQYLIDKAVTDREFREEFLKRVQKADKSELVSLIRVLLQRLEEQRR